MGSESKSPETLKLGILELFFKVTLVTTSGLVVQIDELLDLVVKVSIGSRLVDFS